MSSYGGFTSRASSFRSANRVFNSSRCFRCKSMRSSISPRAIFLDGDGGVFAAIDAISQAMIVVCCGVGTFKHVVLAVLSCQQMLRCQRGGEWPMCPFVVDDDMMG